MSRTRYISPVFSALVSMGMGDKTRAFALLDKAYEERSEWMMVLKTEPEFDPLRGDPRFQALIEKVEQAAGHAPK
jgi:serine/threonine-protein kinase